MLFILTENTIPQLSLCLCLKNLIHKTFSSRLGLQQNMYSY